MREPTPEQAAILAAAVGTTDNLLVNALAGTGKTSTIEMICAAIQGIPILYLAFNKRIVDEAVKRMPSHVECRTQNSVGHRVWGQATGRRLVVAADKMRTIVRALISEMPKAHQGAYWGDFSDILKWCQRAKRDGYVPKRWVGPCQPVMDWEEFTDRYDDDMPHRGILDDALMRSISAAYEGGIDYDDQIYMPVIFGGPWPKFPLVIVDEAQDLSPLNHAMLEKLVAKRLIAVGDPWQSIYAFRGAVCNGMSALHERFSMTDLPLSVTFRVPKTGVERARSRVPHFVAALANPIGEVTTLTEWSAADVPAEAAIICRNNAPLISLAFKLLRSGRAIKLVGMDIGAGLVRTLRKLGPLDLHGVALTTAIDDWTEHELRTARRSTGAVYDRQECLHALCEGRSSLGDAIANAEDLFRREGPIQLLSGHKSKGLEWPVVFHLDPWRIPSKFARAGEALEQELNVKYVIETRFKERLILVDLEGWRA
jgi:DNA helicase-2/ATP-dependent DNA helicase PcrA